MDASKNYYEILGVSEAAKPAAIKKAYRKLAMKHHPDKGGDEKTFKQINEANETLTNKQKRAEYDDLRKYGAGPQFHHGPQRPHARNQQQQSPFVWSHHQGSVNIEEIFGSVFTEHGPFRQQRQQRNRDVHIQLSITLAEAYTGVNKRIAFNTSNEQKIIDVAIPKGVLTSTTLRLRGLGDSAITNIHPGDVLVTINVQNNTKFHREGQNLHATIEIGCFQAMLGAEKTLKMVNNEKLKVKIPAGTQPGQILSLRGKGMPIMDSNLFGDLFIELKINIPKNLTTDQKILIQDLLKST